MPESPDWVEFGEEQEPYIVCQKNKNKNKDKYNLRNEY